MKNAIAREARKDAKEFARAQMFYGDGAGIRRRLIAAKVESKVAKSDSYARFFQQELARQDMAIHASKAQRERLLKDTSFAVRKNIRGLVTGDYRAVNSSIIVILAGGYLAHQTGFDRVVYEKGKKAVTDFKARRRVKKMIRDDPRIFVINPNQK